MFLMDWLQGFRRSSASGLRLRRRRTGTREPLTAQVESLEQRALLTAGLGDSLGTALPVLLWSNATYDLQGSLAQGSASGGEVDVLRVELQAGQTFSADLVTPANTPFAGTLRVFDSTGSELAKAQATVGSNSLTTHDAQVSFTATIGGSYYLGVSSLANDAYDPLVGTKDVGHGSGSGSGSGSSSGSTSGDPYTLALALTGTGVGTTWPASTSDSGSGSSSMSGSGSGASPPYLGQNSFWYSGSHDSPISSSGDLSSQVSDWNGGYVGLELANAPTHGRVTFDSRGGFLYVPQTHYVGTDSFQVQAVNGAGLTSQTATVYLNVNNNAPYLWSNNNSGDGAWFNVSHDRSIDSNGPVVYGYDTDGDPITLQLVQNVQHGALTLNADGSFHYAPATHYVGDDSFQVRYVDPLGSVSNVFTVHLGVANYAPSIWSSNGGGNAISYNVSHDHALDSNGPAFNGYDADGDPLTLQLVQDVQHGALTLNADGSFHYVPTTHYVGSDSFQVRYVDSLGAASDVLTVSLNVVNQAPYAWTNGGNGNTVSYSLSHDQAFDMTSPAVSASDSDGDVLTVQLVQPVQHGALTLHADGTFRYVPDQHFTGGDSFQVRYVDSLGAATDTYTIQLSVNNSAPSIWSNNGSGGSVSYTLPHDQAYDQASPAVSGYDAEGDSLTLQLVQDAQHGSLTLHADGTFHYVPATHYVGSDSFQVRYVDSLGAASAAYTIALAVQNSAPSIWWNNGGWGDTSTYSVSRNTALTVAGPLVSGYDPEQDPVTWQLAQPVQHGSLQFGADGGFTYTPAAGYVGTDGFSLEAADSVGATSNVLQVALQVGSGDGSMSGSGSGSGSGSSSDSGSGMGSGSGTQSGSGDSGSGTSGSGGGNTSGSGTGSSSGTQSGSGSGSGLTSGTGSGSQSDSGSGASSGTQSGSGSGSSGTGNSSGSDSGNGSGSGSSSGSDSSLSAPAVTDLSTHIATAAGDDVLTITGTSFVNVSAVVIGSRYVMYVVNSPTTITAYRGWQDPGTYDVVVNAAGGTSTPTPADRLTYVDSSNSGSGAGGGSSSDSGTGSGSGTGSASDSNSGSGAGTGSGSGSQSSSGTGSGGSSSSTSTSSSTSSTDPNSPPAVAPPTVSGLSRHSGSTVGSQTLTVTGTNFVNVQAVVVGGQSVQFTVNSPTSLTVQLANGIAGTGDVVVQTTAGTSTTNEQTHLALTDTPAPAVTSLTPHDATPDSPASVTITGTDFTNVSKVTLGGQSVRYVVNSPTSITIYPDPMGVGSYPLSITTPSGTSDPNLSEAQVTVNSSGQILATGTGETGSPSGTGTGGTGTGGTGTGGTGTGGTGTGGTGTGGTGTGGGSSSDNTIDTSAADAALLTQVGQAETTFDQSLNSDLQTETNSDNAAIDSAGGAIDAASTAAAGKDIAAWNTLADGVQAADTTQAAADQAANDTYAAAQTTATATETSADKAASDAYNAAEQPLYNTEITGLNAAQQAFDSASANAATAHILYMQPYQATRDEILNNAEQAYSLAHSTAMSIQNTYEDPNSSPELVYGEGAPLHDAIRSIEQSYGPIGQQNEIQYATDVAAIDAVFKNDTAPFNAQYDASIATDQLAYNTDAAAAVKAYNDTSTADQADYAAKELEDRQPLLDSLTQDKQAYDQAATNADKAYQDALAADQAVFDGVKVGADATLADAEAKDAVTEQKAVADAQTTEQQTLASAIAAYLSVVNDPLSTVEKITQAGATELEAIAAAIAALLTSEAGAAAAEVNADAAAVDACQHTMDGAATTESEADAGAANAETHALDAAVATETVKDAAAWETYDLALNAVAKTETVKDAIAADAEAQAIDQAAETQTVDDASAYQTLTHEVTPLWVTAQRDLAQAADDYWTHYLQINTDIYIASAQATRDDKLNWYSPQNNNLAQGQILQANATFDRLQTEAKANMAWAAKDFLATRNEQWADITAESTYIKDATDLNVAYVDGTAPLAQKAYDAFSKDALDWVKSMAPKMQALLDAAESDAVTWINTVMPEAQTFGDNLGDYSQQLVNAIAPVIESLSNALADDAQSEVVAENADKAAFNGTLVGDIPKWVAAVAYLLTTATPPTDATAVATIGFEQLPLFALLAGSPFFLSMGVKAPKVTMPLTAVQKDMADVIIAVLADMKKSNWAPDNLLDCGAFGKEVHDRALGKIETALNGKGVYVNVLVENDTLKVVQLGATSGKEGFTQIDILHLKPGQTISVGSILTPSVIDDIYDIKSTLGIKIGPGQLTRLEKLLNVAGSPAPKQLTFITVPEKWTTAKGWHVNAKYGNGIAILSALGFVIDPAWNVIHANQFDGEVEQIMREAARIRDLANPEDRARDAAFWLWVDVRNYLSHFLPENTVAGVTGRKGLEVIGRLVP